MKVQTTRFGELDIPDSDILSFPKGIFGFENVHRYALVEGQAPSPFQWMQAVDRPDLAFVVMDPGQLLDDYEVSLLDEDARALGWQEGVEFEVVVILGVPEDPEQMTANLKGPIVIHRSARLGRQVIVLGNQWSPRTRVLEQLSRPHRGAAAVCKARLQGKVGADEH